MDYQKAFRTVPHSLIKSFKLDKKNKPSTKKTTSHWKNNTSIYAEQTLTDIGDIEMQERIFQGDSLSTPLFWLYLIPRTE